MASYVLRLLLLSYSDKFKCTNVLVIVHTTKVIFFCVGFSFFFIDVKKPTTIIMILTTTYKDTYKYNIQITLIPAGLP